jgi:hypothetical protein
MYMFGHGDERVNLKTTFTPIMIKSFQKESGVVLDYKQSATLPSREVNEIGSGWRDSSFRLHRQTSAAEAASFV